MTSRCSQPQMGRALWALAFAALTSAFVTGTPVFAADANLSLGIRDYEKGYYRSAIRNLELVSSRDPHNGTAHYYLGNCYLRVSENALAAEEYKLALNYCRDAKIVDYCRKAVLSLTAGSPSPQSAATVATPATRYLGGTTAAIPLPPSYNHGISAQALRRIEMQANSFHRALENQKTKATATAENGYKADAERIRQEGEMEARSMAAATYVRNVPDGRQKTLKRFEFPVYSPEEIAAKKAYYEFEAKRREELGKQHAEVIQNSMSRRQNGLVESAENLRSQLSKTPSLADSTSIEPLGTNLFVRNYQPISRLLDGMPPVHPALAKTESVKPESASANSITVPQTASGRLGPPGANSKNTPRVETKVQGELLK